MNSEQRKDYQSIIAAAACEEGVDMETACAIARRALITTIDKPDDPDDSYLLPYPVDLPLGAGLRVELAPAEEMPDGLGHYDTSSGVIKLRDGEPKAGQLVTFLHECLHACEVAAVNAGVLTPEQMDAHHDFIGMAANGLASILITSGLIDRVTPEEWAEFQQQTWGNEIERMDEDGSTGPG